MDLQVGKKYITRNGNTVEIRYIDPEIPNYAVRAIKRGPAGNVARSYTREGKVAPYDVAGKYIGDRDDIIYEHIETQTLYYRFNPKTGSTGTSFSEPPAQLAEWPGYMRVTLVNGVVTSVVYKPYKSI